MGLSIANLPDPIKALIIGHCDPSVVLASPDLLDIWDDVALSREDFGESFIKRYFSQEAPPHLLDVINDLYIRVCRIDKQKEFCERIHAEGAIVDKISGIDQWIESTIYLMHRQASNKWFYRKIEASYQPQEEPYQKLEPNQQIYAKTIR